MDSLKNFFLQIEKKTRFLTSKIIAYLQNQKT